jgi:preprotein translocase subunit YajC
MRLIEQAQAQTEQAPTSAAPAVPTPPASPAPAQHGGTVQPGAPAADAPPPPALPDMFAQLVPMLAIMAIVYFIIIRPRQRLEKEQKDQLRNVRRGDTLVTSGGLIGKVTKAIDDNEVEIEIAPNVKARLLRTAIVEVRAKGEPVKDQAPAQKG